MTGRVVDGRAVDGIVVDGRAVAVNGRAMDYRKEGGGR